MYQKPGPDDFYLDENGNMVFTESYHKKRGFCCKSGCRHCPFDFTKNLNPDIPPELALADKNDQDCHELAELQEIAEKYLSEFDD